MNWSKVACCFLLVATSFWLQPAKADGQVQTRGFEEAISKGVAFHTYLSDEKDEQTETIIGAGFCAISTGAFASHPHWKNVTGFIESQLVRWFGGGSTFAATATGVAATAVNQHRRQEGDAYCTIIRRQEPGCDGQTACDTPKVFGAYFRAYDLDQELIGRAWSNCGGESFIRVALKRSFLRTFVGSSRTSIADALNKCRPEIRATTDKKASGFALCFQAAIDLDDGGSEVSSAVVGYGIVPGEMSAEINKKASVRGKTCPERGFS